MKGEWEAAARSDILKEGGRWFMVTSSNFGASNFLFFALVIFVIFVYVKSLGPHPPVYFAIKYWKNDHDRVVSIHTRKGQINHDGLGRFLRRPRRTPSPPHYHPTLFSQKTNVTIVSSVKSQFRKKWTIAVFTTDPSFEIILCFST